MQVGRLATVTGPTMVNSRRTTMAATMSAPTPATARARPSRGSRIAPRRPAALAQQIESTTTLVDTYLNQAGDHHVRP